MKRKRFTEEQIIGVLKNIFIEQLWRSVKYEDIYLKPTTRSRRCAWASRVTSSSMTE